MPIEYETLEATSSVVFTSEEFDLLQFGLVGEQIHRLLNRVAIALLTEANKQRQAREEPLISFKIPQTENRDDVLIRARIVRLREGSLEIDLSVLLATVFAQPGAVAVLENLVSSAIWALGARASRVIGCRLVGQKTNRNVRLPATSARRRLGPVVDRFLKTIQSSTRSGRLIWRTGDEEVIIEFFS
jgi:hypothetical protein